MRAVQLLIACAVVGATVARASPPMSPESITTITAALPECTGGWIELGGRDRVYPKDLAPRLAMLSRPSSELDKSSAQDLYQIAKGFLTPVTGAPKWTLDGNAQLKCPAHPKEAVKLMEYLVGKEPDEMHGNSNALEWLGLAYETGATGAADPTKARQYYLRFRMHVGALMKHDRWSDGTDVDFLANVERAHMRPYLDALAQNGDGGAARMALAEAALPNDPAKARQLLRTLYDPALNQLLKLEEQNRVPIVANSEEIGFWAQASNQLFGYRKYAARMLRAVREVNGGTVPTAPTRPSIGLLRPYFDFERVKDADPTRDPIAMRALVTPAGRAIYVEACLAAPAQSLPVANFVTQLDAARLYVGNMGKLPKLPIATIGKRPAYGWVILPAVQFVRSRDGKLEFRFADLPADQCTYSAIADAPQAPTVRRSN